MQIEIRKLAMELLDDWLHFFDKDAFCDDGEWSGCYCMCYHWTEELAKQKPWACSVEDAPYNRKCAIRCIKEGTMQGYLTYCDGKVVGWCNANAKQTYRNVNFDLSSDEALKRMKIKSVVCFCIAPDFRGKGIASELLKQVCSDAAEEGFDCVEAYPFRGDAHKAYHGPRSMYEKNGFVKIDEVGECVVLRKTL